MFSISGFQRLQERFTTALTAAGKSLKMPATPAPRSASIARSVSACWKAETPCSKGVVELGLGLVELLRP